MSGKRCTSTRNDYRCEGFAGHEDQHHCGGLRWIVSDATIAEAEAMAQERTEKYTSEDMYDDLQSWSMATTEQRSEAFHILLAAITADAYHKQDADLIVRLRRIRNRRDAS